MGLTKINMWISIIFMIVLISIPLMLFGLSLKSNSNITLDSNSEEYIDNYANYLSENQITSLVDDSKSEYKTTSITGSNETSTSTISDALAVLNFLSTIWNVISGLFIFIFNIPSFILMSLIPKYISSFNWLINLTTYIIFIIIAILFKKFITS